ncbi:MAG: AMP-binding protein [Pseudomonadota bacterium]
MNATPAILAHLVAERAATTPDLDVLTFESGAARPDQVRTYRQLWEQGLRGAQALAGLGLQPGDHFALLMANHAEFVDAMVAASIAGAVFVPVDPRAKGDKLAYMLDHARCKGVIVADYALANLAAVRERLPLLDWILVLDTDEGGASAADRAGTVAYRDALPDTVPSPAIVTTDADSAMQLIFSSGTTGDPKGIVMTHRRFCDTSRAVATMFGYQDDERPYSGLSLTHANAQIITLGASLVKGLRAVFSRRFTKSRLWDVTRRHGCTTFTLLGGMTTAVYSEQARADDSRNPVRFVVSAGMPAAIWDSFKRRFGVDIVEFYGAAEGGLTVNPAGAGPAGSIGRPVPSLQYRIVDDAGNDCAPGMAGELLFRHAGGAPFKVDYFGNPEASNAKCAYGWLHMGDIVRQDEQGWLYFEHRKGGGIRRNGEFIDTAAVEKTIAECGMADDVFVYGVPAASGAPGEKNVVAAVVPKQGAAFDPQQIFCHCRAHLDAASVPSYVQVVAQIPKTASEKPLERLLLAMFGEQPEAVHEEYARATAAMPAGRAA